MVLKRSTTIGGMGDPPFKKARCKVTGIRIDKRTGQFSKEGDVNIILSLGEVKVIEADSPYPFKTAELTIRASESTNSKKGIFEKSIDAVLGLSGEEDDSPIWLLEGAVITLERQDDYVFFTRKDGVTGKGTVWRVVEIQGAKAKQSPLDKALELLEGKTEGEFVMAAAGDTVIRQDMDFLRTITSRQFTALEAAKHGLSADDKGVYHRS